jgi:hypothetical protein
LWPGLRLPGSVTVGATTGCPATVPPRVGLVGEPTSVPEAGPCSGCPDQCPGAVHADPVARAIARWRLRPKGPRVQLGCPRGLGRCLAARGLRQAGGPWPRSVAPPLAAPVARCSSLRSVASRPVRSRLRLVNQSRFPLPSARRLRSEDSVIWFRLARCVHLPGVVPFGSCTAPDRTRPSSGCARPECRSVAPNVCRGRGLGGFETGPAAAQGPWWWRSAPRPPARLTSARSPSGGLRSSSLPAVGPSECY